APRGRGEGGRAAGHHPPPRAPARACGRGGGAPARAGRRVARAPARPLPPEPAAGGLRGRGPRPHGYSTDLSTLAGTPAAIEYGGTSAVTTLLAPITQRSPTVTPLVMTTLAPHQVLSPT